MNDLTTLRITVTLFSIHTYFTLLVEGTLKDPIRQQHDEGERSHNEHSNVITNTQVEQDEEVIVRPQQLGFQLSEYRQC